MYALLWKTNTIQVWHFPRGSIPEDISIQEPDPSGWGTAQALFGLSSCNVSDHFADMSIVLNIVSVLYHQILITLLWDRRGAA